jgi:long-chain acyl-CoA synthetase
MSKPTTIPELFYNRVKQTGPEEAVLWKEHGRWRSKTWNELESQIKGLARGISDWVEPKDIVCLLSENRPEWWVGDLAILSLAGASAPIYATNPAKDIAYILNDCEAKLLLVSNKEQLDKVRAIRDEGKIPKLQWVVVFEETPVPEEWAFTLKEVLARNADAGDPVPERMAGIDKDSLATLIYTSGTTGEPKGVMLSHWNLVSNTIGAEDVIGKLHLEEKLMLSFLPLSHSLERTAGYYAAIYHGFKVAFAESVPKLVDNMSEVNPTMLVSVPRIYEKLYAKVMEGATGGLKRTLVLWALATGKEHAGYRVNNRPIPFFLAIKYAVANALVFSKVHAKLGGRLKNAISGGAPLAVEIANFLQAIGLNIFEGYGLSETSPVLSANKPGQVKVGSVGTPWPGVEIKIAPEPDRERDGEILAKGPGIMQGYYNKADATAEVFTEDGWFKTGDIGYVDRDNYLFITDRKKEMIKTAGGKYVAPQPIENNLKVHGLVEQVVVIGDRRKYCVALIVPAFEALENKLEKRLPTDLSELNNDPQVRSLYQQALDEVNKDLGRWEQIKRFHLLPAEMTQETGELTPTLKVKRRIVNEKYQTLVDGMYPD